MANDISFPWEMFMQAQQQKNQNRQQMNQDIAGMGQGLGQGLASIGDIIGAQKKKKFLDQITTLMSQQGQQKPPVQGPSGYVPPNQEQGAFPPVPAGQTPPGVQDNSQQINSLMMQYDPQSYMKDIYPKTLKKTMGGAGKRVVYQAPDGTVSLTPVQGSMPLEVSDAQAMQYTATPKSAKDKNKALESRAEAWQRSIDTKQIDALVSRTGVTPKQQSVLQMNNLRSARAISILNNPKITWQELALGEIDLTGIMQGGVPMRDEIVAIHFPGWQEQVSKWKTYATGHPQETVPPDIKNKVKSLVQGVIGVDNTILKANSKFSKNMLGPTIRGGMTPQQGKSIDEMTGVLTQGGGQGGQSGSYSDPGKEARYQEWKKAQGL